MTAQRFDWAALMRAGLIGLRLKPDEFWALTPAEFALLLGKPTALAPLSRGRLDELLSAYPDTIKDMNHGRV